MLDISEGYVTTGNTRESVERDTLVAHIAELADQLPKFERANGAVPLDWIGEQVDDEVLGSFDFTTVDERTLQNARQNARNWTSHAKAQKYPGFVDGKFEFYAIPHKQNGKTVAVKYALRGVKTKAADEV